MKCVYNRKHVQSATRRAQNSAAESQLGHAVVVGAMYAIERTELSRRRARVAPAYLTRSRTMTSNTELAAALGLSRAEGVPTLTGRLGAWLESDAKVCSQLGSLEKEMDGSDHPKYPATSGSCLA
jgi:hypothetical protein